MLDAIFSVAMIGEADQMLRRALQFSKKNGVLLSSIEIGFVLNHWLNNASLVM